MLDFIKIYSKKNKNNSKNRESDSLEVCLDFKVCGTKDLMTRGHAFYGVWDSRRKVWNKNELEVARLVDELILEKVEELKSKDKESIVNFGLMENYPLHRNKLAQQINLFCGAQIIK